MTTETKNEVWAIVELFGHSRIAGKLSEYNIGGASLVRVDVPAVPGRDDRYGHSDPPVAAHTRAFGAGAIYSINFVDEFIATEAAAQIRHKPIDTYGLKDALNAMDMTDRQRLLGAPADEEGFTA